MCQSVILTTLLASADSQPYCVPLLRSSRPITYQMQANQCATITNAQSMRSNSAKEFSRNLNFQENQKDFSVYLISN